LIEKNSLVTAMEFSRCAPSSPLRQSNRPQGRSLKTQQRSSRSTLF